MKQELRFEVTSTLAVSPTKFWEHARSMKGVNAELMPLARMTVPADLAGHALNEQAVGRVLFKSWILFFGFIPVDYHALVIAEIDEEHFLERSSSLIHHLWEHERRIEADPEGLILRDRLRFRPRLPLLGYLLKPIYQFVFGHRHRRLQQIFKASAVSN